MTVKDTCLLIAGPFHQNTVKTVEKYKNIFDLIIISTYKNKDLKRLMVKVVQ